MTLRIDRLERRVRLSGNFRSEHVHQVKAELDRCQSPVALDLEEVGLADVEAVRFLKLGEAAGDSVLNCASFIRMGKVEERGLVVLPPKEEGREWKPKKNEHL